MSPSNLNDTQALKYHKTCGRHKLNMRDYDWNSYKRMPMMAIIESFIGILDNMNDDAYVMNTDTTIICTGGSSVSYTHIPTRLRNSTYSTFCGIVYTVLLQSAITKDMMNNTTERTELVKLNFMLGYGSITREGIMISLKGLKDDLQKLEQ